MLANLKAFILRTSWLVVISMIVAVIAAGLTLAGFFPLAQCLFLAALFLLGLSFRE